MFFKKISFKSLSYALLILFHCQITGKAETLNPKGCWEISWDKKLLFSIGLALVSRKTILYYFKRKLKYAHDVTSLFSESKIDMPKGMKCFSEYGLPGGACYLPCGDVVMNERLFPLDEQCLPFADDLTKAVFAHEIGHVVDPIIKNMPYLSILVFYYLLSKTTDLFNSNWSTISCETNPKKLLYNFSCNILILRLFRSFNHFLEFRADSHVFVASKNSKLNKNFQKGLVSFLNKINHNDSFTHPSAARRIERLEKGKEDACSLFSQLKDSLGYEARMIWPI